jgi:hypothetical protein
MADTLINRLMATLMSGIEWFESKPPCTGLELSNSLLTILARSPEPPNRVSFYPLVQTLSKQQVVEPSSKINEFLGTDDCLLLLTDGLDLVSSLP